MVGNAFNSSTWQRQVDLWLIRAAWSTYEFQAKQGPVERSCLKFQSWIMVHAINRVDLSSRLVWSTERVPRQPVATNQGVGGKFLGR